MTRRRKKEIMKSLFSNYVDKPLSKMDLHERLTWLSHNIEFQLGIRNRKITKGKEHKEIIFMDENDPSSWVCKRKFIKRLSKY